MDNDYDEKLDKGIKKELEDTSIEKGKYNKLEQQISAEYTIAYDHQDAKRRESGVRLKLYNNQRRDRDAVGDTTMFSIHQTVLASLYSDQLQVEFSGRVSGDEEVANNLNILYQYDYEDMEKDESDYDWIWDTLFFGRGLCLLHEFRRDPDMNIFLPVPEVWDPLAFLRDPRATSVNGNKFGKGAARFYGRQVKMSKADIENKSKYPYFFNDINWGKMKSGDNDKSLIGSASDLRQDAQNLQDQSKKADLDLGANTEYTVTEWWTRWELNGKVKKIRAWLNAARDVLIGVQVLGDDDTTNWSLIDRPLYPTSHDWDGTSIPDLTEDKQRHRAVAQNLGLKFMIHDLYPMYFYDSDKIKNKSQVDFEINKAVGVPGDPNTAFAPMRKASPNIALLDFIYNSLDMSAQKATATPEIQQGSMSAEQRTLGELNIIKSQADTRYALSAKIFGRSEKRFAYQWYKLYKDNFAEDIDEKLVRLTGAFGEKWRPLTRENIVTSIDPDVRVTSKVLSRMKKMEDLQMLTQYMTFILNDPTVNKRWAEKKLGRLYGLEKDEIERLLPPTIDERVAERQNEILNENEDVPVLAEDNHVVHLEIHAKAADTDATFRHVETHKIALEMMKTNPELFPVQQKQQQQQQVQQQGQLPGQPNMLGNTSPSAEASLNNSKGNTNGQL